MASIKLSQAMSLASNFLGARGGVSKFPKAAATDLLKKNPLELDFEKSPTAHLVKNPLEFTNITFPRDLGTGGGHFIIFYSISNNKTLKGDRQFNEKIGVKIDSEDIS